MADPLAYFITFSTYGTWLHGREQGSVDRDHNSPGHPFLPADGELIAEKRGGMNQPEYRLDAERRAVVLKTIREVSQHRGWTLLAAHVRSNHVHIIVVGAMKPERIMGDFKAWCSRRLREAFGEPADRHRWTEHGSTIYLWTEADLAERLDYVLNGQGEPMARFDGSSAPSEPHA